MDLALALAVGVTAGALVAFGVYLALPLLEQDERPGRGFAKVARAIVRRADARG